MEKINFEKIKHITILNKDVIDVKIEGDTLFIDSNFRPDIVDSNFNELNEKITRLRNEFESLNKRCEDKFKINKMDYE